MKQVIITTPSDIISIEDVIKTDYPIIGFALNDGYKVTLMLNEYLGKKYFARTTDGWVCGNCYSPYGVECKTIEEWAEFFITTHKAKMYVFDSSKELFIWLAE